MTANFDSSIVPARRRRHSGSLSGDSVRDSTSLLNATFDSNSLPVVPPPRPKSTPGERPKQRRRQESPKHSDDEDHYLEDDKAQEMQADSDTETTVAAEANGGVTILKNSRTSTSDRPTRPLPSSKSRSGTKVPLSTGEMPNSPPVPVVNLHAIPTPANPHMLPVQAHVTRNGLVSTQRKLFVILEQACLEAYRISSGGAGGKGGKGRKGEGDVKYTLLNCDDHQGILAKL